MKPQIKTPQTMFHLSSVQLVASTGSCWLTKSTTCHFLRHFVCCFKWSFFLTLSTVGMMTCDLQVIQSQLLYSSRWERRVCWSGQKKLICCFPNASRKTPQFISVAYDGYALKVSHVWMPLRSSASPCVLVMGRRRTCSDGISEIIRQSGEVLVQSGRVY